MYPRLHRTSSGAVATKPITLILPDETLKKLKVIALVRGTSVSELLAEAAARVVKRVEEGVEQVSGVARETRSLRAGLGLSCSVVTEVAKYPCPCCGYLVFGDSPGSYDICPICFWEDDLVQLRWPQLGGGANAVPLVEGQENFLKLGATEQRFAKNVRAVSPDDKREPGWRHIDATDFFEPEASRIPWPEEPTTLYYWRPTFWRRSTTEPQPVAAPPSRVDGYGTCESCESSFPYYLIHNGFNDSTYAYCDHCGRLAILNLAELEKRIGPLPPLVSSSRSPRKARHPSNPARATADFVGRRRHAALRAGRRCPRKRRRNGSNGTRRERRAAGDGSAHGPGSTP